MTNRQRIVPRLGLRRQHLHVTFMSVIVGLVCLITATRAFADFERKSPEEELLEAQLEFQGAKKDAAGNLRAYIALAEIWTSWKDVDPLLVESALQLAAEDVQKPEPVRDYARKLLAYARLRRGDVFAAQESFRKQGYITDWLVVGPFDNEGKAGFDQEFGPEAELAGPIVPGRAYSGKERPVRYRTLPSVFRYGWVDFGHVFRPKTHICGYATTFIYGTGPKDATHPRKITLFVGSDGAHTVTFNGRVAISDAAYRGFDTGRQSVTVELLPGPNRLSVKACGADSSPMFAVRVADEKGVADPSLKASTDIVLSERASENVKAAGSRPLPPHPRELQGPLTWAMRIEEDKRPSAEELSLATKYLLLTGGDDSVKHQARDLAKRAAEARPTVENLLMLAELSEDRNAAAAAISRAEKKADPDDVRVLLARAAHRRSGPSPHEAFPLYDRVLEIDPDNLIALRGRVELYNRAGLRRTALAALESVYRRRPHSVLLANMVASQQAALGLSSLASEAEDRYAARRFDDSSYLTDRLDLSLARHDHKAALHWLSRIEESDPHALWTYRVAARVHRAMADRKRAVLDLEEARAIAPEDIGVLKSLADLRGRLGDREEQLSLLREVLRLQPQQVEVRKYVDHIEPPEAPPDEKYAMAPEQFLKKRHAPNDGHPRRTLQDLTVSTVYENGLSSQFRQVVFQPLTDAAAATSRQYAFQYQADRQRVQLKGARVYRADGSIDEAIENGEGAANDPSISMYTSARTYYVQFPRLEPGDVVELRYRIDDVTPRNEFADYFGDVVYMQSDEPIAHSEYVLITPKSRVIKVDAKLKGLKERVTHKDDQIIHVFTAENVPPIVPEQSMPPWSEVLGFVHVSTYSSWNELGKWYWGLAKEQLDLDQETREKLQEITKNAQSVEDKVKAVYAWVTKNTRYVALEFGIYGFKPRRCVQTVSRGWGDCKDKATVIVTFLRELGIDANLVVLRTKMRGDFNSNLASLAPFDHAIAYVPELDLYLDGTAEHTGIYELPVMDHDALGLLILDGKAKLVRLPAPDPTKNVIARHLEANIDKKGDAQLRVEYAVSGYSSPGFRSRYEAESTRNDRLAEDLGGEFPGMVLDKYSVRTSDLGNGEAPVEIRVKGKAPGFGRLEGNALSIPALVKYRLTPRFASLSSRKQTVDLTGFSSRKETVELKLPAGASVDSKPKDVSHDSRFGSYSVKITVSGNLVTAESSLSLKVSRVTPEDYADFRKFCVDADQALSQRLVVTP